MSQLQQSPSSGPTAEAAAWADEPVDWTADTPDWSISPNRVESAPPPAQPAGRRKGALLLAAVAIAGVLAGAVGTVFFVTAAFVSAAEDIGRGMSEGLGSDLGRSVGQEISQSMQASPGGPVEEFPPVAPGELGRDAALNQYAQSCFAGDLQACDELWFEAPPLSQYEDYGTTCGGRVKRDAGVSCADLE
jgi:hypothetical protein